MEKIEYTYTPTPEFTKKESVFSEMFSITGGKKVLFTLLCLFIITNAVYVTVNAKKLIIIQLVYFIIGILILGYTWLLPQFIIKRRVKNTNTKDVVSLSIQPSSIVKTVGNKSYEVNAKNYRGYRENEEMYIVYYNTAYMPLPKEGLTQEQQNNIGEMLAYFHNPDYFKSPEELVKESEPEFPPFVPPDGFVPEEEFYNPEKTEETPTIVENEDAENE